MLEVISRKVIKYVHSQTFVVGGGQSAFRTDRHKKSDYIKNMFGEVPSHDYRVTYKLDPDGPLEVLPLSYDIDPYNYRFYRGCNIRFIDRPEHKFTVCFLPKHWVGKRISRIVHLCIDKPKT
jgi:hypothetical protein